ncbi:MAG: hypothetical protein KDJ35_04230 [Alphaproteobacteria bacterium]|nr:hypothetical protein [Alphaproteobacteria bacterium]
MGTFLDPKKHKEWLNDKFGTQSFQQLAVLFEQAHRGKMTSQQLYLYDENDSLKGCQISIYVPEYTDQTQISSYTEGNIVRVYAWTPPKEGINVLYNFNSKALGTIYKTGFDLGRNYDLSGMKISYIEGVVFIHVPATDQGRIKTFLAQFKEDTGAVYYGHEAFGRGLNPDYLA